MYHELFDGQNRLPYHIFLIDAETSHSHTHAELELCFLLCGNAEFHVHHQSYPLYEHDFMIVPPFALHRIQRCSNDCRILFLHIDLPAFRKYVPELAQTSFAFSNIMNNRSQPLYLTLYQSLRKMLNTASESSPTWRLDSLSEVILILKALLTYYQSFPDTQKSLPPQEGRQRRMLLILEYLEQHWQEPVTLSDLARETKMSPSYFSRFFKDAMGIGFLSYLTRLRLKHSLDLLLDTDLPIIDIALECGFNDYKTYGRLFKKEYGENPQLYRKSHAAEEGEEEVRKPLQGLQILDQLSPTIPEAASSKKLLIPLKLNLEAPARQRLEFNWNHTLTVGSAARLLRHKIQEHVLYAKKHIQLHNVRFSDLFSEDMHLYFEDQKGQPHFNWEYLDEIFDFLNTNGLHPFLVFDSMPDALATQKNRLHPEEVGFTPAGQTCLPKSMDKFLQLLDAFVRHYIQRYSATDIISHCRIQLWALPEVPESTWNGTEEQFYELVRQTYFTLRRIAPDLCLGSPSTIGFDDFAMFKRFLEFCQREHIDFDFVCLNAYGFTSPLNKKYPGLYASYEKTFPYSTGDKHLNKIASQLSAILSGAGYKAPVVVTEWGLNPYIRDLSRDTSFMASWMAEHLVHLSPDIKEICYCLLTDYFPCDSSSTGYEFIGGQGLLTHSGIPKPAFSALEMLEVLGDEILYRGRDCIFTRAGTSWRLLIYHYSYYSEEYLNGKQELLFEEDRYNIYQNSFTKIFQIQLTLPVGTYRIETVQLNQDSCAPYEEWLKMGKPESLTAFYHQYLMNKCYPDLQVETVSVTGQLQMQRAVPVHGVMVVKIDRR